MTTIKDKFGAARGASGKTIEQTTALAGLKSTNTYMGREGEPAQFRLGELKGMYDGFNDIAKDLLFEAVQEFFLLE